MTRFAIDWAVAVRLVREGLVVPDVHQLVAPSVLRSHALSAIYAESRAGDLSSADAREMLDRLTTMRIRLLGDRVSRGTAWKLAAEHDWDDTEQAEYLAVARLQADALVALDPHVVRRAPGLVQLRPFEDLLVG